MENRAWVTVGTQEMFAGREIFFLLFMYKSMLTKNIQTIFLFVKSQLYLMHIDVTLHVYNWRGSNQNGGCIWYLGKEPGWGGWIRLRKN